MDYSIHDAVKAGFNKIVIIIRRDIEKDFREVIGNRIEKNLEGTGVTVTYAFQDFSDLPEGFVCPPDRQKPWGTGHAVLSVRDIVKEPFCVINADDYYGTQCFRDMHDFLVHKEGLAMAGFVLGNTLSDNGGVTRGVCRMDQDCNLLEIQETKGIEKGDGCAVADGKTLPLDALVSMNMWGMPESFMASLEEGFVTFLQNIAAGDVKSEYLLPIYIGDLLKENKVHVQVLPTPDVWFGVTYREDKDSVKSAIRDLIHKGRYKEALYSDLKRG